MFQSLQKRLARYTRLLREWYNTEQTRRRQPRARRPPTAAPAPIVIEHPAFGRLTRDQDRTGWTGWLDLPSFAGFDMSAEDRVAELISLKYRMPETVQQETELQRRRRQGRFDLYIEDESGAGPSPEQVQAFLFLKENEPLVSLAVLEAILVQYQDAYRSYLKDSREPDVGSLLFPDAKSREDLKSIIGLRSVSLRRASKTGSAYLVFIMECTWDPDHGLCILTHRESVLEVGDYSTALLDHAELESLDA